MSKNQEFFNVKWVVHIVTIPVLRKQMNTGGRCSSILFNTIRHYINWLVIATVKEKKTGSAFRMEKLKWKKQPTREAVLFLIKP
jgi:hypothetical protein